MTPELHRGMLGQRGVMCLCIRRRRRVSYTHPKSIQSNFQIKQSNLKIEYLEIVDAFSDHEQKVKREIEGNVHFLIKDKKQFDLKGYERDILRPLL